MGKSHSNRFASYGTDGELVALVAEGLPDWPESGDITDREAFTDQTLVDMCGAYEAEARTLAADREHFADNRSRIHELTTRIPALREEWGRRFSEEGGAGGDDETDDPALTELAALSEEDRAAVTAYAEAVAAEEAANADDDANAELARLAMLAEGTPTPLDGERLLAQVRMVDPQETAAATARGVAEGIAAGLAPLVEGLRGVTTELREQPRIPAQARRITAAELARFNAPDAAPPPNAPAPRGRLVYAGESGTAGLANGADITQMNQLVEAYREKGRTMGETASIEDERIVIGRVLPNEPSEARDFRDMRGFSQDAVRDRIRRIAGPEAIGVDPWNLGRELPIGRGGIIVDDPGNLVASGGLAAPVEPYYPQLLLAQADRPVAASMPGVTAERGGIRLVLPPSLALIAAAAAPGTFADGAGAGGTTDLTSATAAFTAADVGSPLVETDGGTKIPAGTIISAVVSGTDVTLSQNTTAGAFTGVAFKISNRNPNNLGNAVGVVTAAQDAAGPPSVIKYTYDVPLGTQAEHDVYSVYTSLQFANLTARTFPEQVEVNIRLANALAARSADTQMLNYITGWSTLLTFNKTFGTARQLLAQFEHMAAYYRNVNRMDPSVVLRLGIPAWVINAMRGDYVSTFIGGGSEWSLSDEELASWFQDRHILPFFYWDGPSDISQLFPNVGSGAINTNGINNATPVPVPDYPGQGATTSFRTKIVSFMWAEGTWLNLTTGELNLGLVRDSILNSQNRFRNFEEVWETPAFVGLQSLRCVHTVASDGTYGAPASITLGAGSGL
jgi:hypothetical protein